MGETVGGQGRTWREVKRGGIRDRDYRSRGASFSFTSLSWQVEPVSGGEGRRGR